MARLAGVLMSGGSFGLIGNVIVGIVGAVVGSFVFDFLGVSIAGLSGSIVTATPGAVILTFLVRLVKRV